MFVTDDEQSIGGAIPAFKYGEDGKFKRLRRLGNALIGEYRPVSGYKEVVCGQLNKWTLYRMDPKERDLHPYVKPLSPRSEWVLKTLPTDSRTCGRDCLWGEVTLPSAMEVFWRRDGEAPARGSNACGANERACRGRTTEINQGQFCMYGPWIAEEAHSFHPEIHPIQAFWGQVSDSARLFLLDDASDRFSRAHTFERTYLSKAFRPWSGQALRRTLHFVLRLDPAKPGSLKVSGADGTETATLDVGRGTVSVTHPIGLKPVIAKVCAAGDLTQAVVSVDVPVEAGDWKEFSVSGTDVGIEFGHRGRENSGETVPAVEIEEHEWELQSATQWSQPIPTRPRNAGRAAAAWRLDRVKSWSAVLRHEIEVQVGTPDDQGRITPPESLKVAWSVRVVDADNNDAPVDRGAVIALDYDRHAERPQIDYPVAGLNRVSSRGRYLLTVRFGASSPFGGYVSTRNLKVIAKVTARDGKHVIEREFLIHSIIPNLLAEASGYSLRRNNGKLPEHIVKILHPLVNSAGCSVSPEKFATDLDGGPVPRSDALRALVDTRRRSAGMLRQWLNNALRDKTIDETEFFTAIDAAGRYRDACAAGGVQ